MRLSTLPPIAESEFTSQPRRAERRPRPLASWVRAFAPLALATLFAFTMFAEPIRQSVGETPHPELVYAIFIVALFASTLCALALRQFLREDELAHDLRRCAPGDHLACLNRIKWNSDFDALYRSIFSVDSSPGGSRSQQHENELHACEGSLYARLTLPNYLSGGLVGLGLIGTFIGLLSTLSDLGTLFASMTNMGVQGSDPIAMFGDMLRRLQEPMRGMGTAFVASLYGLLGSLLIGLVLQSVRKSGQQAATSVRTLVRELDAIERLLDPNPGSLVNEALWLQLLTELRNERRATQRLTSEIAFDFKFLLQAGQEIAHELRQTRNDLVQRLDSKYPVAPPSTPVDSHSMRGPNYRMALLISLGAVTAMLLGAAASITLLDHRRTLFHAPSPHHTQFSTVSGASGTLIQAPVAAPASPSVDCRLQVDPGMNLQEIARHNHVSVADILQFNPDIVDPNHVRANSWIRLPDGAESCQ